MSFCLCFTTYKGEDCPRRCYMKFLTECGNNTLRACHAIEAISPFPTRSQREFVFHAPLILHNKLDVLANKFYSTSSIDLDVRIWNEEWNNEAVMLPLQPRLGATMDDLLNCLLQLNRSHIGLFTNLHLEEVSSFPSLKGISSPHSSYKRDIPTP